MEQSILYDLLSISIFRKWKSEEEAKGDYYTPREQKRFEEVKNALTDKSKELLDSYSLAIKDKMDGINYNLNDKILKLGIKIGMELEKAFHKYEEF